MTTIIEQFRNELLQLALYQDKTVATYISCIYKYFDFVKEQFHIDPIKTEASPLHQWLTHLKQTNVSNSYLIQHRSALISFFTFLVKMNVINNNPTDGLVPIKKVISDLNQPITKETAFKLLTALDRTTWIGQRNFMIISCLWALGLRRQELTNLKIHDFDPNYDPNNKIGLLIVNGKGKKQRALFVVDKLYDQLINYLNQPQTPKRKFVPLFPNKKGSMLSGNHILKIVHQTAQQAGITQRITPHVLRHSFATEMYRQQVPVADIQVMMGHETEAETALYIHVPDELKKQALEQISLEGDYSWPYLYGGASQLSA